jgi:hypothetical protein
VVYRVLGTAAVHGYKAKKAITKRSGLTGARSAAPGEPRKITRLSGNRQCCV